MSDQTKARLIVQAALVAQTFGLLSGVCDRFNFASK